MKRYKHPVLEPSSYGARIEALIPRDLTWDNDGTDKNWLTRMTTWTLWPYRYWAAEDAKEQRVIPGVSRVEHCMYRIAMMSALRQDGNREFNQWYIIQKPEDSQEVVFYAEHTVLPTPEAEAEAGTYAESMTFAIDNGFIAPNDDDLLRLGFAIAVGEERGVDRIT